MEPKQEKEYLQLASGKKMNPLRMLLKNGLILSLVKE